MSGNTIIHIKKRKYSWVDKGLDSWLKQEANNLRMIGFKADTATTSQLLLERVIKPNNITLCELVKPKINLKGKQKWKKQML